MLNNARLVEATLNHNIKERGIWTGLMQKQEKVEFSSLK
jgi:hypothetical protein